LSVEEFNASEDKKVKDQEVAMESKEES